MDLRIRSSRATAAEEAAIDSVLGGSAPGLGHQARSHRDLLLPVLHAVQARIGWVSSEALDAICRRLTIPPADAFGVASFYHLISTTPRPAGVVHVCDDIACRIAGAETLCQQMSALCGPEGQAWQRSPCLGQCERAPAALVTVAQDAPLAFTAAPATAVELKSRLQNPPTVSDTRPAGEVGASIPQMAAPGLRLLQRIGTVDPGSLPGYRATAGYQALEKALAMGPEAVVREVTASKLAGRGGAAFPTGRKWEAVAKAPARPHYLVCNADESEPGTFKDRLLMEEDPFAVVEGMTLAGYATGCQKGFLYLRGEYPLAAARMEAALQAARAAGLLGRDILGKGFAFDIEIRRGAGAYICGEETALFNSIEGKRGEPRNKPPYPVEVGLFGKPTVVNNVETLVNVPALMREGGAAYAASGTAGSAGVKLFCVSGQVAKPGVYELPFGATVRELLSLAGTPNGIQAILLGGAAGSFVGREALDTPLTFEGTRAIGASLGSGVVMVFGDGVDLADILARIAEFFRVESCGQCVPCRVGTVRQEELLGRLRAGAPLGSREKEMALLKEISQAMRDASICGLGQTASSAIESGLLRLGRRP